MGEVHRLIEGHGRQGALALAPDIDRRVVEIASAYMGDEDVGLGFVYSGFAVVCVTAQTIAGPRTMASPH